MIELTIEEIKKINQQEMGSNGNLSLPRTRVEVLGYHATSLLQYLIHQETFFKLTEDGFFYNTMEFIEKHIFLSRRNQETALRDLINLNLVETKMEDKPSKKYYKINHLGLFTLFHKTNEQTYGPSVHKRTDRALNNNRTKESIINVASQHNVNPPDSHNCKVLLKKKIIKKPTLQNKENESLQKREMIKKGYKETVANKAKEHEEKRKEKLHRVVTFDMQVIIDYWVKKQLSFHKEETKVYARSIDNLKSLLKGTLFNSFAKKEHHNRIFSITEIKRSIDNFVLAAYNLDYEPANKKYLQAVTFVDFFYSTRPCSREEDKSTFLKYLLNKPTLIANSKIYAVKNDYPHATKILVDWYKKTFGNRDNGNYSLKNINDLVYATHELKTFYEQNKDRLDLKKWVLTYNQADPVSFLAVQTTRAMDKMLRENEGLYVSFTTSWMKTERTLQERLPLFLKQEHMMR